MKKKIGWLVVIDGSMKSGKSDEAIRRKKIAEKYGNVQGIAFNPSINIRNGKSVVSSYSGLEIPAISIDISQPMQIIETLRKRKYSKINFIIISEVQFFNKNIVPIIAYLRETGYRIIAEGLGLNHQGEIFGDGVIHLLKVFADEISELKAFCECNHESHKDGKCCSSNGVFSARYLTDGKEQGQIIIGREEYYACCPYCFFNHRSNRVVSQENQEILDQLFANYSKKTKSKGGSVTKWQRLIRNNPYPNPKDMTVDV